MNNREIKCRTWIEDTETMIYGCMGYINKSKNVGDIIYFDDIQSYNRTWFTGLKDKNGKEIYEGDIVRVDWKDYEFMIKVFTVTWNLNGWYCFYNNEKDGKVGYRMFPYNGAYDGRKLIEIIGNIYENPELLK